MINLWKPVRNFLALAVILLLCLTVAPAAQASNGDYSNGTTTSASPQQNTTPAATVATTDTPKTAAKPKAKAATKPRDRSVLDSEVLDSPIGYFKHAFTSEEDESEAAPNNGAVMITVKALVATLLSTIM